MTPSSTDESFRNQREFLARRGHALRTPLNVVLGFSELLLSDEEAPLPAHQREQVQHIRDAGQRLLGQVQDLIDHARLDLGKLALRHQRVELGPALAAAVEGVRPEAQRRAVGLAIDAAVLADACVEGDATRVQQLLAKLLHNAVRFSPDGSTVRLRAMREGLAWVVEVCDAGPGLNAAQRELLFQPFALEAREAAGLGGGVGLAVAQGLAQAMQGHLEALPAAPGRGGRLRLVLPADDGR